MPTSSRSNLYLGVACLVLAAFVAFVWVPLDTETGLIEKVRRQTTIGDALAPTVAALFVGLGGVLLLIVERKRADQPALTMGNLRFVTVQIAVLITGFLIMRYAGPLAVALSGAESEYRLLRDTAPWKYIGYFLGGTWIVAGLIAQAEGRLSARSLLVAVCVVLALIAIYDLPFDDLLLPPNGDV